MLIKRRTLLVAAGASTLPAPAIAQAKQIQLAGASYDMREAILGEFAKRTNNKYQIEVFPASQLGKETDINQGLSLGSVDTATAQGVPWRMALSNSHGQQASAATAIRQAQTRDRF